MLEDRSNQTINQHENFDQINGNLILVKLICILEELDNEIYMYKQLIDVNELPHHNFT